MTSIRGRRVQRLLKREFADSEYVLLTALESGDAAVLGVSADKAALCATNGKGKQATLFKWAYKSSAGVEMHFDLLKDSLPLLGTNPITLTSLGAKIHLRPPVGSIPPEARRLADTAIQALS